jgi:hypothetical protein
VLCAIASAPVSGRCSGIFLIAHDVLKGASTRGEACEGARVLGGVWWERGSEGGWRRLVSAEEFVGGEEVREPVYGIPRAWQRDGNGE